MVMWFMKAWSHEKSFCITVTLYGEAISFGGFTIQSDINAERFLGSFTTHSESNTESFLVHLLHRYIVMYFSTLILYRHCLDTFYSNRKVSGGFTSQRGSKMERFLVASYGGLRSGVELFRWCQHWPNSQTFLTQDFILTYQCHYIW